MCKVQTGLAAVYKVEAVTRGKPGFTPAHSAAACSARRRSLWTSDGDPFGPEGALLEGRFGAVSDPEAPP